MTSTGDTALAAADKDLAKEMHRLADWWDAFATTTVSEIDHINGVLFIDRISKLKRDRVVKKFTKAAKAANKPAKKKVEA